MVERKDDTFDQHDGGEGGSDAEAPEKTCEWQSQDARGEEEPHGRV